MNESSKISGIDSDVLAFHITQLAQTLTEGFEPTQPYRIRWRTGRQITYSGNLVSPLSLDSG